MSTILHTSINLCPTSILQNDGCRIQQRPIICFSLPKPKLVPFHLRKLKGGIFTGKESLLEHGVFVRVSGELNRSCSSNSRRRRVVVARFNQGFGFNGGGGGGKDNGINSRVIGNLILAIGLTYLSMTGQLGWVLDAIVSIWLLVVLIPVVGLGAFLWWAGRDIVQSSCPNCGNDFQVFKSTLNDELQLCPFCSQPFSVVDNKFVRESVKFSNEFTSKEASVNDFIPRTKKGKASSTAVVDVDAEVTDVD